MNNDDKQPTQPENSNESSTSNDSVNENSVTNDSVNAEQSTQHQEAEKSSANKQHQQASCATEELEKTWHNKNALKRGIAMLGYGFIAGFVRVGITLIAIFQFFSLLFAEKPNQPLVSFGQNLNTYLYQINQFLTVNSEMYPFPFADWPDSAPK